MNLFVYGTLMEPELLHSLTGKRFPSKRARLLDFRCVRNPRSYPYVLSSAGDHVDGILLQDVGPEDLTILDRYEAEGDLYFRSEGVAETADGPCACATYVGNPKAVGRLEVS